MIIYKILENGYFGGSITVSDSTKGIPLWHTRTSPPTQTEGTFTLWTGNQWVLTDSPPPIVIDDEIINQESLPTEITVDSAAENTAVNEEILDTAPATEL